MSIASFWHLLYEKGSVDPFLEQIQQPSELLAGSLFLK